MKNVLSLILALLMVLSITACGGKSEEMVSADVDVLETAVMKVPSDEEQETAPATEPATEPPIVDAHLFLKVSSITFSVVGESEDIYLGLVPRELVTWESDDPSVVSVENGVLTANSVGTTTIRATYYDQQAECTAGCLAETQEELESLGFDVLSQPKRLLPEVDLEVPCTYFDNDALVGDSIAYMMLQCESKGDYLGNMLFLTRGGTSLNGFVNRFKNIYYMGREMNLENAIAESGVDRMYILIGSNDIASTPQWEAFFENWDTMLGRIREKSPDVEVVLISNIPRYADQFDQGSFFWDYNTKVIECNDWLRQKAAENDWLYYLDLHAYIEDHCGRMAKSYNLDGYHLNTPGYDVWMKVLRYYAQYELEGGTLS